MKVVSLNLGGVISRQLEINKYVEKIVSFCDFNRDKLVRMEEDGDTSDEISDIENCDETSWILFFIRF